MKRILLLLTVIMTIMTTQAKTLIVYYSYTNNVHSIVTEHARQIIRSVTERIV